MQARWRRSPRGFARSARYSVASLCHRSRRRLGAAEHSRFTLSAWRRPSPPVSAGHFTCLTASRRSSRSSSCSASSAATSRSSAFGCLNSSRRESAPLPSPSVHRLAASLVPASISSSARLCFAWQRLGFLSLVRRSHSCSASSSFPSHPKRKDRRCRSKRPAIGIFGYSMGGRVAILSASGYKSLGLLAPVAPVAIDRYRGPGLLRLLRDIFLIAYPPLLSSEGCPSTHFLVTPFDERRWPC